MVSTHTYLINFILIFGGVFIKCEPSINCDADLTLNIERKCGESYSVSLQHNHIPRSFLIYIPSIYCNDDPLLETFKIKFASDSSNPLQVPILIALHCIGCTPSDELTKWQSDADQFGFLLIIPRGGTHQQSLLSWNADQCCGPALEQNSDDLGFITKIIHGLQCSFTKTFPLIQLSDAAQNSFIFVTGFSNGGFMTDKIAWSSTVGNFPKIIAAAPTAGYIYDHMQYIKDKHKQNNIAMYFHHSASDHAVNPNGCCVEHMEGCCCGIAQQSNICLPLHDEFEHWLRWNHCDENTQVDKVSINENTNKQIDCAHATPEQHKCDAPVSLCFHSNVHHAQWAQSFPLTRDVLTFFTKSLCLHQNGQWNEDKNECKCDENYQGLYCITEKQNIDTHSISNTGDEQINLLIEDEKENYYFLQYIPETSVIMIFIVFLTIAFVLIYKRSKSEYIYSTLQITDISDESSHSSIIEDIQLNPTQDINLQTL